MLSTRRVLATVLTILLQCFIIYILLRKPHVLITNGMKVTYFLICRSPHKYLL